MARQGPQWRSMRAARGWVGRGAGRPCCTCCARRGHASGRPTSSTCPWGGTPSGELPSACPLCTAVLLPGVRLVTANGHCLCPRGMTPLCSNHLWPCLCVCLLGGKQGPVPQRSDGSVPVPGPLPRAHAGPGGPLPAAAEATVLDHNPAILGLPRYLAGARGSPGISLCATGLHNPWTATAALAALPGSRSCASSAAPAARPPRRTAWPRRRRRMPAWPWPWRTTGAAALPGRRRPGVRRQGRGTGGAGRGGGESEREGVYAAVAEQLLALEAALGLPGDGGGGRGQRRDAHAERRALRVWEESRRGPGGGGGAGEARSPGRSDGRGGRHGTPWGPRGSARDGRKAAGGDGV